MKSKLNIDIKFIKVKNDVNFTFVFPTSYLSSNYIYTYK